MSESFLSLLFALHLLAVDLAMAGPLVAVWMQWRAARLGDPAADVLARRLAGWSLAAALVGVGLGLAMLALVPTAEAAPYRQAIDLLDAKRWWFVAGELLFYAVAMALYVGLWRRMAHWPICHRALAVVAATDLIYHFPPLFAVISTISMRPELWNSSLGDRKLYWHLLLEGETISRVVHHWLAAAAVGATALMLLAIRRTVHAHTGPLPSKEREQTRADGATAAHNTAPGPVRQTGPTQAAARIALAATMAQILVGVWVLVAMPAVVQRQVLGEDVLSSVLFGASLLMALGLMHHLAVIALGDASRGAVLRAAGLMVLTVLLMVAMFHRARHCAFQQMKPTTPQANAPLGANQLTTDN